MLAAGSEIGQGKVLFLEPVLRTSLFRGLTFPLPWRWLLAIIAVSVTLWLTLPFAFSRFVVYGLGGFGLWNFSGLPRHSPTTAEVDLT
jgi:hypothetical protein